SILPRSCRQSESGRPWPTLPRIVILAKELDGQNWRERITRSPIWRAKALDGHADELLIHAKKITPQARRKGCWSARMRFRSWLTWLDRVLAGIDKSG